MTTKVKVIKETTLLLFQEAINHTNKLLDPFATQTHVFYNQVREEVEYIAVLYYK